MEINRDAIDKLLGLNDRQLKSIIQSLAKECGIDPAEFNIDTNSITSIRGALENASALHNFLPAIIFLVACFISFATGTAWGTFGILIPITVAIFGYEMTPLALVSISASLAGSVTGDHCSPISETAIMSSTAARVDFMMHVVTQLPYAIFVAVFSAIGFFIAGFIKNPWICLAIMIPLMVGTVWGIKLYTERNKSQSPEAEEIA